LADFKGEISQNPGRGLESMERSMKVSVGEIRVGSFPEKIFFAQGVSSGIVVAMYDPIPEIIGMLYAAFPEKNDSLGRGSVKVVETGVESLYDAMIGAGSSAERLSVRLTGGANLLNRDDKFPGHNLGKKNILAAETTLKRLNLRIRSQDVGGNHARSVFLCGSNGKLVVKPVEFEFDGETFFQGRDWNSALFGDLDHVEQDVSL
jgi:chemotaxis protein CheD